MMVPKGMTESQVLATIEKCVNLLAPSFAFGYYTSEDMKQEARLFCLECLPKFDPSRNLEAFLYSATKHFLINLHRNKFKRAESPCAVCHKAENSGGSYPTCLNSAEYCKKYLDWKRRNANKAKLVNPSNIEFVTDDQAERMGLCCDSKAQEAAELKETLELIDLHLPANLRSTYLRMRDGISVPAEKAKEVTAFLKELLRD